MKKPRWLREKRKKLATYGRIHRANPTPTEKLLWPHLKELGFKIGRQCIVAGYLPDFVCRRARIAIEIDGGYHLTPTQRCKDDWKDINLSRFGYLVLRFTNAQVESNLTDVVDVVKNAIELSTYQRKMR